MVGLTKIIEELEEAQVNCCFDLQQDWNEEKQLMQLQLGLLVEAVARLKVLATQQDSQFFKSSMSI